MPSSAPTSPNRDYALGLARAFAGAIIFGLPLLMTMEMWFLGIAVHPPRLLVFLAVNFVILVGLSRFGGFERTDTLGEDVMDALAACGVGILGAAACCGCSRSWTSRCRSTRSPARSRSRAFR